MQEDGEFESRDEWAGIGWRRVTSDQRLKAGGD